MFGFGDVSGVFVVCLQLIAGALIVPGQRRTSQGCVTSVIKFSIC